MNQQSQEGAEFIEILEKESDKDGKNRRVYMEAYVATNVEPKQCGPLVQRLSAELQQQQSTHHHHIDISHLKRVKRVILQEGDDMEKEDDTYDTTMHESKNGQVAQVGAQVSNNSGPSRSMAHRKKRKRRVTENKINLEVLIGAASQIDRIFASEHATNGCNDLSNGTAITSWLESKYQVQQVCKVNLPGRTPQSEEEWKEYQVIWPTTYFPNKSIEQRQAKRQLTNHEVEQMRKGMQAALSDAEQQKPRNHQESSTKTAIVGTVILDPTTGDVVGRAAPEREIQLQIGAAAAVSAGHQHHNPLATSILYAIQSVSRIERECAMQKGMDSNAFQGGQYLCTGYDVYTTVEPSVFEAMALVHSRVRRVVVGCSHTTRRGALTTVKVHALPGTNHKYRAFLCCPDGDVARQCRQLLDVKNQRK